MSASEDSAAFLSLVLDGERRAAERLASRVFEEQGVQFLYDEVVRPALRDVGLLWRANRITIADEHLAMATAQASVAALYHRFPWQSGGPRAVVGCVEGEHHDFGARMIADVLALDGWDERFLGADVPSADFAQKVAALKARLVALSVTLRARLPTLRSLIDTLRILTPNVKILVGGLASEALQDSGADAIANRCSDAVEVARGWK